MIAPKTIYRTADGRLVDEGEPGAAFLVCRAGTHVSVDTVRRFGLKFDGPRDAAPNDATDPTERQSRTVNPRTLRRRSE